MGGPVDARGRIGVYLGRSQPGDCNGPIAGQLGPVRRQRHHARDQQGADEEGSDIHCMFRLNVVKASSGTIAAMNATSPTAS
jgi:hypothetical protein